MHLGAIFIANKITMKKMIALTLVLALGFQFLSKLGLLTFYHFYTEYIIEEYCENKDQPQLRCEGTCFLKKGLGKEDHNTKSNSETSKQIEVPTFIISSCFKESVIFKQFIQLFPEIKNSYLFLFTSIPFQPPKRV